jgi:hypothetical protein
LNAQCAPNGLLLHVKLLLFARTSSTALVHYSRRRSSLVKHRSYSFLSSSRSCVRRFHSRLHHRRVVGLPSAMRCSLIVFA